MILFEARSDENGDPVLFDVDKKDRRWLRDQHPTWLARFKARDFDHAKLVFRALVDGPVEDHPDAPVTITPTPKAVFALEAEERRRFNALSWWEKLVQRRAHKRDPMNLERRPWPKK